MEQKETTMSSTERVLLLISLVPKVFVALAVIAFVIGFIMYSGFNERSGVSLMCVAPVLLCAYPFLRGFEFIIRAAVRYLQINGEPYGK